jgi:hypothetical protein
LETFGSAGQEVAATELRKLYSSSDNYHGNLSNNGEISGIRSMDGGRRMGEVHTKF